MAKQAMTNGQDSPIQRLPVELLTEIFRHTSYIPDMDAAVHSDGYNDRRYPIGTRRTTLADYMPAVLQSVCSFWREIALAIPTLFTQNFFCRGISHSWNPKSLSRGGSSTRKICRYKFSSTPVRGPLDGLVYQRPYVLYCAPICIG